VVVRAADDVDPVVIGERITERISSSEELVHGGTKFLDVDHVDKIGHCFDFGKLGTLALDNRNKNRLLF